MGRNLRTLVFIREEQVRRTIVTIVLLGVVYCATCRDTSGILVTLTDKDIKDAVETGVALGGRVSEYVEQHYKFGEENVFEESGIIRTTWGKLVVFSGLMSARGEKPDSQEIERIVASAELQIDLHTFGNKVEFASGYRVHLVQGGKTIEPTKISADHTAYRPAKRIVLPGFPAYRATVRSYFPYGEFDPLAKTEVVLVKNRKKIVFEVNFADYK